MLFKNKQAIRCCHLAWLVWLLSLAGNSKTLDAGKTTPNTKDEGVIEIFY